jgi:hypothetical protein
MRGRKGRFLQSLFTTWDRLLVRASSHLNNTESPDHPFWYGERTNIGWVALAAFKKGWLPIQEPSITRRKIERRNGSARTHKITGRSDLWIVRGRGDQQVFYDFEAKESDLSLHALTNEDNDFAFPKDIREKLRAAVRDVCNKDADLSGDKGIGSVFLRLYVSKHTDKRDLIIAIRRFTDGISNSLRELDADFMALHIAPYSIIKRVANSYEGDYFDLGLAIVGKVCRLPR